MCEDAANRVRAIRPLVEHERALERLYEAYARHFPEHGFWLRLQREQGEHVQWLEALVRDIHDGAVYFGRCRLRTQVLGDALDRLAAARAKPFSLHSALSTCVLARRRLLASGVLVSFSTDPPALKRVLDDLARSSRRQLHFLVETCMSREARRAGSWFHWLREIWAMPFTCPKIGSAPRPLAACRETAPEAGKGEERCARAMIARC